MNGRRPIRDVATGIVRTLQDSGHEAYFVGGCVRDQLLGLEPLEYDVATDAVPDRIQELFPGAHMVGASFGVVLVRSGGHTVEIATFRSEGGYSDHRRPDTVMFCDRTGDVRRRDFTINGIFYDPVRDEHYDQFDGEQDLRNGVLRAIGTPSDRFEEDHLRMLRAVRFAARFELEIEPDTAEAIRRQAGDLDGVSKERVGGEIRRMASEGDWAMAVSLLHDLGLDDSVLGMDSTGGAWERCRHLEATTEQSLDRHPAALAAWLLDRGDIDPCGLDIARLEHVGDQLVSSNQERSAVRDILECLGAMGQWGDAGVAARKRLASRGGFRWSLMLLSAVEAVRARAIEADVVDLAATGLAPKPLIGGDVLIGAGMQPGPKFALLLDRIYDAQLEGRISTPDEALQLAFELDKRPE